MILNLTDLVIKESLEQVLDFLPYPFLIAEEKQGVFYNLHVNHKFLDEIGYTCEEMPTVKDWFQLAYPNEQYRTEVIAEWNERFKRAQQESIDEVQMSVLIHTKSNGDNWYEVKSSVFGRFQLVAFVNTHSIITKENELRQLIDSNHQVLSVLSHDLRTPIISLNALTRLALKSNVSREEFEALLPKLHERSRQTLDLLDTTLYWAKSNFSGIQINLVNVDVREAVESVLQVYNNACIAKQLSVTVQLNHESLVTDNEILIIVIRNLLSNAIKFTPDGGRIVISASTDNTMYSLCVADTGIGLTQEDIAKILNDTHISSAGTAQEKGHGMGLRLCRQLLQKVKGTMEITSEPGKGTRVCVVFQK